MRVSVRLGLALAALVALATGARAENSVTIGAVFGVTHDYAAKAAIETALDVINNPHPGLEKLPLGAGQGLPRLGGARIAITLADDLGNPSVAQSQAFRLVTHDHVAALIGAGDVPELLAASAVAERHGVPFMVPDAAAPNITARGLKFVFRPAPLAADIAKVYAQFLAAQKIHTVTLVVEDSDWGPDEAAALHALGAAGFHVSEIAYPSNASDLASPVAQLRAANPDAAIFVSHLADAILFAKTMKNAGYKPPIEIGDGAAFSDPDFVASVGNLVQGLVSRGIGSLGAPDSPTAIVDDLFKAKTGRDLDDRSARIIEGVFVLADAIDRAGSTDPAAIRSALAATDLKPSQLIVGYNGVKFDASGQNTLASTYLTQLQGKQYVTVWPPQVGAGTLMLPFKGWE
jgi:branched-chain amino acid transport system substrate-binding protein